MLKSIESNVRAFVRFTNSSQRLVEVYWINFSGENVLYTSLEAGRSCVVREVAVNWFTWGFKRWNLLTRSTRSAHIRGYSSVRTAEKDSKSTTRTFFCPKPGSSSSTNPTTVWCPSDGKRRRFTSHWNRFATLAYGKSCSWSVPTRTSGNWTFQRLWRLICFTSLECQRDLRSKTDLRICLNDFLWFFKVFFFSCAICNLNSTNFHVAQIIFSPVSQVN